MKKLTANIGELVEVEMIWHGLLKKLKGKLSEVLHYQYIHIENDLEKVSSLHGLLLAGYTGHRCRFVTQDSAITLILRVKDGRVLYDNPKVPKQYSRKHSQWDLLASTFSKRIIALYYKRQQK